MFADAFVKLPTALKNFANKPAKLVNVQFFVLKNQLPAEIKISVSLKIDSLHINDICGKKITGFKKIFFIRRRFLFISPVKISLNAEDIFMIFEQILRRISAVCVSDER